MLRETGSWEEMKRGSLCGCFGWRTVPVCVLGLFGLIREVLYLVIMCVCVCDVVVLEMLSVICWDQHVFREAVTSFFFFFSLVLSVQSQRASTLTPGWHSPNPCCLCRADLSVCVCVCATISHYINCLFVWLHFFNEPDIKLPRFHDNLFIRHAVVF